MPVVSETCAQTDEQGMTMRHLKDALKHGAALLARHLAMEGAQRYPHNALLQEYARILAPPRIVHKNIPPHSSVRANHDWLKHHRQEYRGRWIALRQGALIGMADSLDMLVNDLKDMQGVLLTKA